MTAVVLSVPASGAEAAVKPNALGPGWTAVTLQAFSGGGCAQPSAAGNLSPIINEPCNDGSVYIWYWRALADGSQEFVNYTGSEALGFSGGEFKLETPNINTTIVWPYYDPYGSNYAEYSNSASTYYMVPSAKGKPLGLASADQGWNVDDSWQVVPY